MGIRYCLVERGKAVANEDELASEGCLKEHVWRVMACVQTVWLDDGEREDMCHLHFTANRHRDSDAREKERDWTRLDDDSSWPVLQWPNAGGGN
jgi:hypothetical protein